MITAKLAYGLSRSSDIALTKARLNANLVRVERLVMAASKKGIFYVAMPVVSGIAEFAEELTALGYSVRVDIKKRTVTVSWGMAGGERG